MPNKSNPGKYQSKSSATPDKSETNDQNADKEFPGYPHYPATEDIMNVKDAKRVPVDLENISRSNLTTLAVMPDKSGKSPQGEKLSGVPGDDDDIKIVPGTEADVTADDLLLLAERDTGLGSSRTLTGDELDVPGSEDDDDNEEIGEEDEENNYYSLGGDAHENLEEDKG